MDLNNMGTQAGITGSIVFAGGILYRMYRGVNGKRCRCKLCGYDLEADFKVDDMPPTPLSQSDRASGEALPHTTPDNFTVNNPLPHPTQPQPHLLHPPHS